MHKKRSLCGSALFFSKKHLTYSTLYGIIVLSNEKGGPVMFDEIIKALTGVWLIVQIVSKLIEIIKHK